MIPLCEFLELLMNMSERFLTM